MPNSKNELLQYAGMATQIMCILGVAVFAGIQLDKYCKTNPLFVALLPIMALIGVFYKVYKQSSKKQ